ncbi:MAG: molybdopterin-dependent oxidoreductase, partial [Pseudomonadota bacterium]
MTMIDSAVTPTKTTCPYCGVGCGVLATPDGKGGVAIAGDPEHPANFGRLCSKGSALGETVGLSERLLHPMVRVSSGNLEQVAWTDALDHVANRLQHIIAKHGPDSVAFYLSGQLLTEDYYVANKLMKGFVGTANVDTNSRLCMSSSVAGHRRAFGADTVPGCYEDLDQADLLVLVGSNAAWCHPVLFQRVIANKQNRGARIVVIDPRQTETSGDADLFLGLKPGTDTALFSGLLTHLADNGALDQEYISEHTSGLDDALARARSIAGSIGATALATGLTEADVATFFQMFLKTPRAVTLYSQGVNQSAQGTDKVNAILNCHLATGRIGKPGASPFSLTGQPNAMGGREVGGLANQLAAHMNFTPPDIDRVRRFWKAPRIATHEGLKAVQMFQAIGRGDIKALWVMGTNPAVSLPNADAVRVAMRKLDLLVISENVRSNDSINSGAHVLLPAHAWGEKSGTVTNSERRISRQRGFLPAAGEAKSDWWIMSEVARRLGYGPAFAYSSAADIFREHAALSDFENGGSRDFDIGAHAEISEVEFDELDP